MAASVALAFGHIYTLYKKCYLGEHVAALATRLRGEGEVQVQAAVSDVGEQMSLSGSYGRPFPSRFLSES